VPRRLSPSVLIIVGSTASGKTELAIDLARAFDAEIVGADSRQIYHGMPVGTAAPSAQQLATVPHHLIGFLEPAQRYSAAQYAIDASRAIAGIHRRGKRAIVAGGTGFYVRALTGNVALAPRYDETLRTRLAREAMAHPPEFLHGWLAQRDRARAAALHPTDTYRVLRALEIALGMPTNASRETPLPTLTSQGIQSMLVFLDVPWNVIDQRIVSRTDAMLRAGLVAEAERVGASAVAANAVGYPQALAYLRGWSTEAELRLSLQRATRRYARRQRAWFRGEAGTLWLAPDAVATMVREKLGWSAKRE
jgi:tRNA dimethylallyltransferase